MKKQIKKETTKGLLEITISNESGSGPFFSITADFYENRPDGNSSPRRWSMGGCLHEEILAARPDLKPFVDIHGSYLTGEPCHAIENGFYWLSKAAGIPQRYAPKQDAETCFSYLLSHLRIDEREGNKIMGEVVNRFIDGKAKIATSEPVTAKCKEMQEKQGIFDAKNEFKKIVDSMKPRWQNEAAQAIKQLEEMP